MTPSSSSCCSPSPRLQQPLPAAVSLPVVSSGGSESAANDPPPLTSAAASGGSGGGGGFLKYGVVFSHEKTYETYAERAYELKKTALNAICVWHVIGALTFLAGYANPQTHLPLRNLIMGFCVNTILALAPLVMRVFYLNNKKAMQVYKLLAFVALLILPVNFARIHHDMEDFKSISPALVFIIHFGCYSMLLTDKFVAFLAEAGLVAVAVFAVESIYQQHHAAIHLIFDAFGMAILLIKSICFSASPACRCLFATVGSRHIFVLAIHVLVSSLKKFEPRSSLTALMGLPREFQSAAISCRTLV